MKITILVPTYRRPVDLRRCLGSLERLDRLPDEVLVVHRPDDDDTKGVLAQAWALPVRAVEVRVEGVVAAVNRGFDATTGDVVVMIDDDAAPHPDWLTRIAAHYDADPKLGALGGRDVIHVAGEAIPPGEQEVGMVSWYGRMVGAHHLGVGDARSVAVLKGVNMSFRITALRDHRADERLLGRGAQVHFEIGLCNDIRNDGWRIVYDPHVLVDHFPSVRHDSDKRSGFAFDAQFNKAHNEEVMILDHLKSWQRPAFVIWGFAVGTSDVPGLLQLPRIALMGRQVPVQRLVASWRGRAKGMGTWWRTHR